MNVEKLEREWPWSKEAGELRRQLLKGHPQMNADFRRLLQEHGTGGLDGPRR
jgi:hypothetical protein